MSEISKAVGQWIVDNVGWTVVIALFLLSCFFKLVKVEIDPLGAIIGWIGKALTKDVRKDVSDLKTDTEIKINALKDDIDSFKQETTQSINSMLQGSNDHCHVIELRMDAMEKSNDMQTVRQIRAHVLEFAGSCMRGNLHTQKDFDNIFDENKEYHELIAKYGIVNDRYKEDYDFIVKTYHRCLEENGFLKESDARLSNVG